MTKAAANRRLNLALAFAMLAMLAACTSKNSARGVVDDFIDQHYVAIDLKGAEPYCTGLALDKLHDEMKLTAGQHIDDTTRKPVVHYKLTAQRETSDHVEFLFRATIEVPEGGTFQKNWMITARKDGDSWKVSNYSEYD
ncbi:MAG TPA: hypothetical protein VMA09_22775 [Candidatus Binataceae bacterium]|nr:hypothetical protein [Candidatus Binataceae bacterium]